MTTKKFGMEDVGITKIGGDKNPKNISQSDWKKVLPNEVYRVARESESVGKDANIVRIQIDPME
ncbi:hypothetical protein CRE_13821 [Caenorhabditis remanei]|uniref:Uncharacterized protein n=1 Tax=Caenorhabditis remanei TaxID=31234 RepID=E3NQM3_CAERE|nr:hypothetical protein CRE_13821 [Caenorhabditis remanei]